MEGLRLLDMPRDRIPQLHTKLMTCCKPPRAGKWLRYQRLIPFDEFFRLLANKQFPVATFIRTREEFDYLQEPDIFHEIFGHCPLLTNPAFAHFTHQYGKLGYAS